MAQLSAPWSSPFTSWHERALLSPFPDPHSFTPTRERLLLGMLLNAQAEPDGISLALFSQPDSSETIAVDARGRVLLISEKDSQGLLALSQQILALPKLDSFWNSWAIKHSATCYPNHRLFVSTPGGTTHQVAVYGYSKGTRTLSTPVEEYNELPDSLWELFGLVLEARADAGSRWDNQRDEVVLGRVREALQGLSDATN